MPGSGRAAPPHESPDHLDCFHRCCAPARTLDKEIAVCWGGITAIVRDKVVEIGRPAVDLLPPPARVEEMAPKLAPDGLGGRDGVGSQGTGHGGRRANRRGREFI
jgi:hypothetical protein